MEEFHKLEQKDECYHVTNKKNYLDISKLLNESFNFAFEMTFGVEGKHRNHRSGGQHERNESEIFLNTFQGKLAEVFLYKEFINMGIEANIPDFTKSQLGSWDTSDFSIRNINIAVKSTKHFGQLLLLEKKDWNDEGYYIPNIKNGNNKYDYFIFVRIKHNFTSESTTNKDALAQEIAKIVKSEKIDKGLLFYKTTRLFWEYDIVGYVTNEDLLHIIRNRHIIPQNSYLNGKVPMDAENYYFQAGDMRPIIELFNILKQ